MTPEFSKICFPLASNHATPAPPAGRMTDTTSLYTMKIKLFQSCKHLCVDKVGINASHLANNPRHLLLIPC